jgi:oxygen-dependent protoporphyrinogen oxidase
MIFICEIARIYRLSLRTNIHFFFMIAIIGAGISGLSLAYYLQKFNKPYVLIETTNRVGGYIKSVKEADYLMDTGPNSILCDAATEQLFAELGISNEAIEANDVSKDRYIFKNGRYQALPSGPVSLLTSSFFSFKTKWKILSELRMKPQANAAANETLADFVERHFGKEAVEYALQPFVSGVYAGDCRQLLANKTFPTLLDYEKNYGSVLKGFAKNAGAARRKSMNFKNGMQTLTDALGTKVSSVRLETTVKNIQAQADGSWQLALQTADGQTSTVVAQKIVVTCPAFAAASFLQNSLPALAKALENVNYPPMAMIHTTYPKESVGFALNGFGGLHPPAEQLFTAGSLWTSSVFKGRSPENHVLFTSFVGGMLAQDKTKFSDEEILRRVDTELRNLYTIKTKQPIYQRITRWNKAIPQYDIQLNEVYAQAAEAEKQGVFICANWYKGVALSDCITKARAMAEQF